MKRIVIAIVAVLSLTGAAQAQYGYGSNPRSHSVDGHFRSDGTYVRPHSATNPNDTQRDNYSSRGNYNPNTGAYGTRTPRY
ncbi:hypothetical protein BJ123_108138 [Rhodopseudomonas thermotolerans]|uniref:PXPV repeat-containing protein n=2 Tax=Rhodopseudomonas TaxID=1073 RepID=A0A336JPX1_9BRAD|nr:hypothetical protein BJ125_108138 [Rhodopseudomonas pentothenatexigens]REG03575.1 hypothetical protein BJ123_108138 [Rhodopseudomonas thermotolerans]SSW90763.1 hypothetical protein SAMN05892882_108138 [Rhodopseudomonas pentothenatexigens]